MSMRVKAAVLCTLAVMAVALTACGGGGPATSAGPSPAAARDPAERGPYAVGLTKMTFERPSTIDGTPRRLETWIWYPSAGAATSGGTVPADPAPAPGGPFPVVIFSHGSGGQPNFYTYFTEHLASWGFVVVAPPHPGNTSADCSPCGGGSIVTSARERPGDIDLIFERLAAIHTDASQPLGRIIDPSRVALAGHSFGGWTAVFAAAGSRFAAAVAMAPGLPETLIARAAEMTTPVMLLGGGKDELVPPGSVAKLDAALPAATTTYVSFPEGHHNTFLDRCLGCGAGALSEQRGHDLVNRYATAFLETYVIKDARYARYLTEDVAPDAMIVHDAAASGQ